MLKVIGSLLLFLLITAPSCLAEIVATKDPLKSTEYNPYIAVRGLTPNQTYTVTYGGSHPGYKKKFNECGFLKLPANSTTIPITDTAEIYVQSDTLNGGNYVNALPVLAAPRCTNGSLSGVNTSPPTFMRTAENDVYITGQPPYSNVTVYGTADYTKKIKTSTCGVLRVGDAQPSWPVTIKDLAGNTVHTISEPENATVAQEPFCKNGQLYRAN
jgi:hypothetical protein